MCGTKRIYFKLVLVAAEPVVLIPINVLKTTFSLIAQETDDENSEKLTMLRLALTDNLARAIVN